LRLIKGVGLRMEAVKQGLSMWFYLGAAASILGVILIIKAKGAIKSQLMESGYFVLILGLVGVISEWTDFATVLLVFTILSGIVLVFAKARKMPIKQKDGDVVHYVHYAREFFPVVLAVFILRAFLFEAYQIPSSSMRPDLTVGDFILVNKFDLGIREPITNKVIIPVHKVKRGDVVVFKDQQIKNRDLIKRVVGISGDTIEYSDKRLTINGVPLEYTPNGTYSYTEDIPTQGNVTMVNQEYIENLTGVKHAIITWDKVPAFFPSQVQTFPGSENCTYNSDESFKCTVPAGEYFMMGDNRDNSFDSRYWGFVPDNAILGRAIYVWMNFHDLKRIGTKI
jgi:signal peptidase I